MDAAELRSRWLVALESASTAVDAAWGAHTLTADDVRVERELIRAERDWLVRFAEQRRYDGGPSTRSARSARNGAR